MHSPFHHWVYQSPLLCPRLGHQLPHGNPVEGGHLHLGFWKPGVLQDADTHLCWWGKLVQKESNFRKLHSEFSEYAWGVLPGWNICHLFWLSVSCPSFPFFLLSEVVDTQNTRRIQRKEDSIQAGEFGKASLFQLEQGLGVTSFNPFDCQWGHGSNTEHAMAFNKIDWLMKSDDSNHVVSWMPSHNKDHACWTLELTFP